MECGVSKFWRQLGLAFILSLTFITGPAVAETVEDCGDVTATGCIIYKHDDCKTEPPAVTEASSRLITNDDVISVCPRDLQVTPVLPDNRGIQIKWKAPSRSADFLTGFRVTLVALDDAGQSSFCILLDLSRVNWANSSREHEFSYNFTSADLRDVYTWYVQVQSVPVLSTPACPDATVTAMVNTYKAGSYGLGNLLDISNVFVTVSALYKQNATIDVIATTDVKATIDVIASSRHGSDLSSYSVQLYRCRDDAAAENVSYCSASNVLVLVAGPCKLDANSPTTFGKLDHGVYLYEIWVDGTPTPARVYRSSLIVIPENPAQKASSGQIPTSVSSSQIPTRNFSKNTLSVSRYPQTEHYSTSTATANATSADYLDLPEFDKRTEGDSKAWTAVVAASVTTSVLMVIVVVLLAVCFRRRRKASAKPHTKTSTPCKLPATKVCILSSSSSKKQTDATDWLALYLRAACACDVTYFRWHLDDIQRVGARQWIQEQICRADHIVLIHTPASFKVYKKWVNGCSSKGKTHEAFGSGLNADVVLALFDLLHGNDKAKGNLMNVTFYSDRSFGNGKYQRNTNETLLTNETLHTSEHKSERKTLEQNCKVYTLMEEFSEVLADLHGISNNPMELKNRHLPTDFDHLDTAEGKQLVRAAGSLRRSMSQRMNEENTTLKGDVRIDAVSAVSTSSREHFDRERDIYETRDVETENKISSAQFRRELARKRASSRRYEPEDFRTTDKKHHTDKQKFDSGFCEPFSSLSFNREPVSSRPLASPYHYDSSAVNFEVVSVSKKSRDISFISPEELSVVGSEFTSLSDRFRAINAGYEHMHGERDSVDDIEVMSVSERFRALNARCEERFEDEADRGSVSECYSLGGRYV